MGHRQSAHSMDSITHNQPPAFRLNSHRLGRPSSIPSGDEDSTESPVNGIPLPRVPRIRGQPVRLAVHWRPISDISPGESLEGLCGTSCHSDSNLSSDDSLSSLRSINSNCTQIVFISAVISNFQLDEVPASILQLRQLNWLDFTHNFIREIPPGIKNLSNLRRLACGNNQIRHIPDEIGDLIHLTWLDFTHNHVTDVSPRLGELSSLAGLGLSDCRLRVFPVCITRLQKLMKLGIFNNRICRLPRAIRGLTSLVKLDVSNNLLTILPKEIGFLQSLTWLNLSHNRLISLPDELGRLVNLRELGLGSNRLTKLPDLRQLTELVMLPVYSNQLASIGTWIGSLQKLEKLDLSCNCLVSIPREAFEIRTLQYLNAKRNQIAHMSMSRISRDEITGEPYTKLRYLDLSENRLTLLPYELSRLRIEDFRANDNVFRRMPLEQPGRTPGTRPRPTSLHVACVNALLRRAANEVKEEIYRMFETRRRYCLKRRMASDGTSSPLIFDTLDVRFPRLHQANFKIPYPKLAEVVSGDGVPELCAAAFASLQECDRCHLTYITQHDVDGLDDEDGVGAGFGCRQIDFLNYGRYVQLPFLRKFCSRHCMDAHVSETAWGNLRPVDASFVAVPSSEDLVTTFFPPMFNVPPNHQSSAFPASLFAVSDVSL